MEAEALLFTNVHMKGADFLRVKAEITLRGLEWTGYWVKRGQAELFSPQPETIRIYNASDWKPVTKH